MSVKPSILFVDDEPNILQALQRMLYSERRLWQIEFASGAWKPCKCSTNPGSTSSSPI